MQNLSHPFSLVYRVVVFVVVQYLCLVLSHFFERNNVSIVLKCNSAKSDVYHSSRRKIRYVDKRLCPVARVK